MGGSGTKGHRTTGREPHLGGWEPAADLLALNLEAASWEAYPICQKNAQWNRQFLVNFAIHLVQQFRFEEAQLKKTRSPHLAGCCLENHRLVLHLRNLMTAVDQGLEVTGDIHAFLETWRSRQEQLPIWTAAPAEREH
jgi:hypothetical protein